MEKMKTCPATVPRRVRRASLISIMTLGIFSMMTPTASAEEIIEYSATDPSSWEIVTECESRGLNCTFTVEAVSEVLETPRVPFKQVGASAKNCGAASLLQTVAWSDETRAAYTFGVTVGPNVANMAFGASSETAHTEGGSTQVTVNEGTIAFIERAQIMRVYYGYLETPYMQTYPDGPINQKYRIRTGIFKAVPDGTDGKASTIQATTRELSDEEWSTC
ncbi:hypothetical protein [Nocardia asiatica]|uniref:hypothetical protein n=1 Tax=Nocardia asiatica TaxID=209252 RepID=UPI0024588E5E|nr:hypothetical protein [Nocardia asiatica]